VNDFCTINMDENDCTTLRKRKSDAHFFHRPMIGTNNALPPQFKSVDGLPCPSAKCRIILKPRAAGGSYMEMANEVRHRFSRAYWSPSVARRAKAPSTLRFAGAVQIRQRFAMSAGEGRQQAGAAFLNASQPGKVAFLHYQ
jgi:hypothetical protein